MTKDSALKRVQELAKAVNESLENHHRLKTALDNATSAHNALVGRLDEAQYHYNEWEKLEKNEPIKAKEDKFAK